MTEVQIIRFEPRELVVSEESLLADSILKQYCDFISDGKIESEPLIKLEIDLSYISHKCPSLSSKQQLVLVRTCMSDVIYSLHYLGLWCAKRTIKMYLTEFGRLIGRADQPPGDLIGSTLTILNILYGRLDNLVRRHSSISEADKTVLVGASSQLKTLLDCIKGAEPSPDITWPICIVHVRRKVIAKVLALWLHEVADEIPNYSFIKPNYIVGSSRKHRNRMTVDNFDLHHETSIRDFRFGKCNTLVISTVNDRCVDMLRCNLVISFDYPDSFDAFLQAKANCRFDSSKYVIMFNEYYEDNVERQILKYINMERTYNRSNRKDILEPEEVELLKKLETEFPPFPCDKYSKNPATVHRSVAIINKYCTKLPSDSFTKLSPEWNVQQVDSEDDHKQYYCIVRLPINSPVRKAIVGPQAPTEAIAIRLAAFTACKVLYNAGELDHNMCPIKKESMKALTPWLNSAEFSRARSKSNTKGQSIGSTKHRQYYRKRIARVFSGPLVDENVDCYLYKFKMTLTCEIPDEQNRRGRRIIDPNETNRNYGIICTNRLPKICSFPVFTRSGEVMISVELVKDNFKLSAEQVNDLRIFHEYSFSKVLRLEKYPTIYMPEKSPFTILLAPVVDEADQVTEIDWTFLAKIVSNNDESFVPRIEDREKFQFHKDDYIDAVVIPWYRLTDRQQFAYYVAEICENMSPQSPFPDEDSGYATFVDYYKSKYNIVIYNMNQPVLDVDHTSARLNLLTPRYVNRKGRTLPSSTAKTRKKSRESLIQKQLLIPELCTIHPFPASFWRKAVCLPAILYRLNSLFLAEEFRREVARDINVGFVEPPANFEWPELHFGWSLKDVIGSQADESLSEDNEDSEWHEAIDQDESGFINEDELFVHEDGRDWKAGKSHSFLRELFVPNLKSSEALYKSPELTNNCTKLIDHSVKIIEATSDMDLVHQLGCISISDHEGILRTWHKLLQKLDCLVDQTLVNEPNLFNVELTAVDSSPNLEMEPTFGELLPNRDNRDWSSDTWKLIKFDPLRAEIRSPGPPPSLILQSLTMSNASDGINLERLETVGDSFLKYSITAYLYCTHLSLHEGKLSYLRSTEISNANLYRLGRLKNLGELMSATKFEPNDNWLAPGYWIAETTQPRDEDAPRNKVIDKALSEVPYDLLRQHSIPDKSIADCVEALIGAYLTASGSRAALLFMRWLGLRVVPDSFDIESDITRTDKDDGSIWRWLEVPPSPLICAPPAYDEKAPKNMHRPSDEELRAVANDKLNQLYLQNQMDKFEQEIEYTFKDRAYLVQAFTHNSFYENHVTECHQRLEFLGDALLDYLITRYLFEDPRCHSPGTLTDLRSALVNNTFFASLAVKYNFHKHLKFISDELSHVIESFVKKLKLDSKDTITKGYTLLINEGESECTEDIEVPKALGDVFESVAGAIYLDSGMSLDQVWQVYFKMMKPEIEYFSSHVPKSPIRELLESMPQNVRFSPSELAPDRKHRVTAEVFGVGRFTGVGRNKHSAKSTAAKRALRMLAGRKRASSSKLEEPAVEVWVNPGRV